MPAILAAARADIHDVVGRADDRLLVFDNEERVPFVAQIVHHANEPANVAGMETYAWFVHHEERVHQ